MKKKYHYEGRDIETGADVLHECGGKEELLLREPAHGKPLLPGQSIVQIQEARDGSGHVEVETLVDNPGRSGPAQVATDAYRKGWDAIFN